MGASLSVPELSRHNKNRLVPHRRLAAHPHAHAHGRRKVHDCGQGDWALFCAKEPDPAGLRGVPPRRDITLEEVARHASEHDAWMVLRGKVYDVTPYLRFHPGGAALLLRVAGTDATQQFDKFHSWVSPERHLEKCLVGYLAPPATAAEVAQQQPAVPQQPAEEATEQVQAVEGAGCAPAEGELQQPGPDQEAPSAPAAAPLADMQLPQQQQQQQQQQKQQGGLPPASAEVAPASKQQQQPLLPAGRPKCLVQPPLPAAAHVSVSARSRF